jgi:hypothetical protein
MAKFKNLQEEFADAKRRLRLAEKHRDQLLDQMVNADLAKVVPDQDGSWEIYIVGPKNVLDNTQYMEFEGEDYRFMGVDEGGRQEAEEQGCDPEEFCDEIVLAPGEEVEWFIKGRQ